jgi:hypothetical protein
MTEETKKVIDSDKYIEFVRQTTSPASSDFAQLLSRMTELEAAHEFPADVPRLLTAALVFLQKQVSLLKLSKRFSFKVNQYNEENVFHMKRELGDICWYIAQACMALDTNFREIMEMNYEKLSARYPEGAFDVYRSENRVEGDL